MKEIVYFAQAERGPIKIGYTQSNPLERIKDLQVGNADLIELTGAVFASKNVEFHLHKQLETHWIRGEWFKNSVEVIKVIDNVMDTYPNWYGVIESIGVHTKRTPFRHPDLMIKTTDRTAKIGQLRCALDETHEQFAKRFGVSRPTIYHWEKFGPPRYGPAAKYVDHVIENMEQIINSQNPQ